MADPNLEDRFNQDRLDVERDQSIGAPIFYAFGAGLAAIGIGMALHRAQQGGNLIADLLHYLGKGRGINATLDALANIGETAAPTGATKGSRTILDAVINIVDNRLEIGNLDIIRRIEEGLDVLGNVQVRGTPGLQDILNARLKEAIHRRFTAVNTPSFFHHNLERLTFGEVMKDQATWIKRIGSQQFEKLQKFYKLGYITEETALDRGIFIDKLGNLRDLRIENFLPTKKIAEFFDFFGQVRVAKDIFGEGRFAAIVDVARHKTKAPYGFFLGGNVYVPEIDAAGKLTVRTVEENVSLFRAGGPLQQLRALRAKKAVAALPTGKFAKLQEALGVGPGYRTRFSLLEKWLINPIKTLYGVRSGKAVVVKRQARAVGSSNALDFLFGAQYPEIGKVSEYALLGDAGKEVPFEELKFFDKLKVLFGASDTFSVVKREGASSKILSNVDLYIPKRVGRIKGAESFVSHPIKGLKEPFTEHRLTAAGFVGPKYTFKYYTAPGSPLERLSEFTAYLGHRLSSLASETLLGISFKPSGSVLGAWSGVIKAALAYPVLKETVGYADFAIEDITGVSPIKGLAWLYTRLRLMQQKVRDITGITAASKFLEKNFPGSINSELSFFTRSLLLPAGVLFKMSSGNWAKAVVGSALSYFLFGGPGLDQTAKELAEEYQGIRKVPVRRNRLWGLGYSPFFGGEVEYYDYSWYHRLVTDARTKAIYGSRKEYYSKYANIAGIPLPTPHNLFGLNNLLHLYSLEQKHYYDRPYPTTAGMFDEFPVIGPFLSATIGAIIKPRKPMHVGALYGVPAAESSIADRILPPNASAKLGLEDVGIQLAGFKTKSNILTILKEQAAIASEPLGVYKFTLEMFGVDLSISPYNLAADAQTIASKGREFYDMNLGGLFGQCFIGNTLVLTDSGYRYIRDIEAGTKVLSRYGEWKEVLEKKYMGEASDLVEIKLSLTDLSITTTSKHHIPTAKKNCIIFKDTNAKDIQPGDYVEISIPKPFTSEFLFTEELAELIAVYIARGICVGNEIIFNLPISEHKLVEKLELIIGVCFGASIHKKIYPEHIDLLVEDRGMALFLEYLVGEDMSTRSAPMDIFLSDKLLKAYLLTLFRISRDQYIYKTRYEDDALLMWLALLRLKIIIPLRKQDDYYILELGEELYSYIEEGRSNVDIESEEYIFYDENTVAIKVEHVEPLESTQKVYDLMVEDLHYYTANAIVVHNTEFIRRFYLSELSRPSKMRRRINPIENDMPTWLPGSRAEVKADRDYYLNFSVGDPYTKIPAGETRLPGPGYEAVSPLHSGIPGVYDKVDKFLILADVAPYSASYREARIKLGDLSQYGDYWRFRIEQAIANRDAVINRLRVYERGSVNTLAQLNEAIAQGAYLQAARGVWDFLTHDILAEIPYFGGKLAPFRSALEKYEHEEIYGDSFADWNRPYETIVRPAIYDMARTNILGAAAKGAVIGTLMSGPGAILNPIVPLRNPALAVPVMAVVGAASSVTRSLLTNKNFIPPHKREEIEAQEFTDKMIYLKARALSDYAASIGRQDLVSAYNKMAKGTFVGATNLRSLRVAFSSRDRRYLDSFLNTPPSKRQELLDRLPQYYADALKKAWTRDYGSLQEHDAETLEYINTHGVIDMSSLVWHPSVPTDALRIKTLTTLMGDSYNLHHFGFYEGQQIETEQRFPNIHATEPYRVYYNSFNDIKNDLIHQLKSYRKRLHFQEGVYGMYSFGVEEPTYTYAYSRDLLR